jgi:hypothetical protein
MEEFACCLLAEKGMHIEVNISAQENFGQIIGVQIKNLTVNAPSATVSFNRAVLDPLRRLYASGYNRQMIILIDALDEAAQHIGAETIVDVLANLGELPKLVRIVLASRPEGMALRHFQERRIPHLVLDAGGDENEADLCAYIKVCLAVSDKNNRNVYQIRQTGQQLVDSKLTGAQITDGKQLNVDLDIEQRFEVVKDSKINGLVIDDLAPKRKKSRKTNRK